MQINKIVEQRKGLEKLLADFIDFMQDTLQEDPSQLSSQSIYSKSPVLASSKKLIQTMENQQRTPMRQEVSAPTQASRLSQGPAQRVQEQNSGVSRRAEQAGPFSTADLTVQDVEQGAGKADREAALQKDMDEDAELEKIVRRSLRREMERSQRQREHKKPKEKIVDDANTIQTQTDHRAAKRQVIAQALYGSKPPRYEDVNLCLSEGSRSYIRWIRGEDQ